jgi:hypothetical protein
VLCRNWTAEGRRDGELLRQLVGPFADQLGPCGIYSILMPTPPSLNGLRTINDNIFTT